MVPASWWKLTLDLERWRSRNSLDAMSGAARIDYRRRSLTTRGLLCESSGLVAALIWDACVAKHTDRLCRWSLTYQQEAGVPAVGLGQARSRHTANPPAARAAARRSGPCRVALRPTAQRAVQRDVAQLGQRTCFGSRGSPVQIRPSRPPAVQVNGSPPPTCADVRTSRAGFVPLACH